MFTIKLLDAVQIYGTIIIYSLGYCYATETGVNKDLDKAEKLLLQAIEYGHVIAASKLGNWYYYGINFPTKREKGFQLLKLAADKGNANAMAKVGDIYLSGLVNDEGQRAERDYELGRQYLDKACADKDTYALFTVGSNYCGGYNGFPEDNAKGTAYIKEAAELGHPYAQLTYAIKFWNGDGVPKSPTEYVKWMEKSARNGNKEAIVRWAVTRYTGAIDGVRCKTDKEFDECRAIFEKALAEGDHFMLNCRDVIDELYAEEARLGRKLRMSDLYGTGYENGHSSQSSGGCYVATAVYGSYDCPEVWTLRRFRDYTLAETWYGRTFIKTYYAISPTIVKWFGDSNWFNRLFKKRLDYLVSKLYEQGVENTPYQDKTY